MTELERHLLNALNRLESQYQERDQQFADTLATLSKQLNAGVKHVELLNLRIQGLNGRIEQLQAALNEK